MNEVINDFPEDLTLLEWLQKIHELEKRVAQLEVEIQAKAITNDENSNLI